MADNTFERIRAAYTEAGRVQPEEYPKLPAWERLPIQMREALIYVVDGQGHGRKDAMEALSGLVGLLQLVGHRIPDHVMREIESSRHYKRALDVLKGTGKEKGPSRGR